MAYVKSHCTKFVFFLFCLSQVQGASCLLLENPYDDLFTDVVDSAHRISERVQQRLTEDGVPISNLIETYRPYMDDAVSKINEVVLRIYGFSFYQYIEMFADDLKSKDPGMSNKIRMLNLDLDELNKETKDVIWKRFDEINTRVVNGTKPIAKRLSGIVKDVEEIILALIPEKKKEIKKN